MADESSFPKTLPEAFSLANQSSKPLPERLSTYARYSRTIAPEIDAAYDRLVGRLTATDWEEFGPRVGDTVPAFLLPDHNGRLVSLEHLLGKGPLIISFNRGHWCPYCRMELEEFARLESQLSSLDTELISIQPELERYTADQVRQRELKFRILTDLDLAYALQVGLVCWVGDEVNDIYKARGIDLAGFHGSNGQFLPVPATFVLTKQGTVSARHVDPDFRRRMEPAHLLECVRAAWDAGLRHSG